VNCKLSLIIPAYNESRRLPPYLDSVRRYMTGVFADDYQVIVVDDGSADGLADLLERRYRDWTQLLLLRHRRNQGKGAALRTGFLAATGELLLFTDADGATAVEQEAGLRAVLKSGADIAVGSRLLGGYPRLCCRVWKRLLPGRLFAGLVRLLLRLPVQDTQCGFKMFRRSAGLALIRLSRERGYLLDVELLALAHHLGYRIAEVAVPYTDVAGSKVRLLRDGWSMTCGMFRVRRVLRGLPRQVASLDAGGRPELLCAPAALSYLAGPHSDRCLNRQPVPRPDLSGASSGG
jgi:dolichyl-phosphate beta-glucosyltransferase